MHDAAKAKKYKPQSLQIKWSWQFMQLSLQSGQAGLEKNSTQKQFTSFCNLGEAGSAHWQHFF